MNERVTIAIFEQLEPRVPAPFRLVETTLTTDGYRSRLCNGGWATRNEAENDRLRRIKVRSS